MWKLSNVQIICTLKELLITKFLSNSLSKSIKIQQNHFKKNFFTHTHTNSITKKKIKNLSIILLL